MTTQLQLVILKKSMKSMAFLNSNRPGLDSETCTASTGFTCIWIIESKPP